MVLCSQGPAFPEFGLVCLSMSVVVDWEHRALGTWGHGNIGTLPMTAEVIMLTGRFVGKSYAAHF